MSTPVEQLYTRDILALAAGIPVRPLVMRADHVMTARSPVCGSEIRLSVSFDAQGKVQASGYEVRACAFGQASLSLFARQLEGASIEAVRLAAQALQAMLKGSNEISGLWPGFEAFMPVVEVPARHAAVMLPFQAFELAAKAHEQQAPERSTAAPGKDA